MPRLSIFAAGLLCGMAVTSAQTAEVSAGGKFSFKPLSVEGLVLRDRVVIGPKFATEHGIEVPAPFLFKVPRIKDMLRVAGCEVSRSAGSGLYQDRQIGRAHV